MRMCERDARVGKKRVLFPAINSTLNLVGGEISPGRKQSKFLRHHGAGVRQRNRSIRSMRKICPRTRHQRGGARISLADIRRQRTRPQARIEGNGISGNTNRRYFETDNDARAYRSAPP